MLWRAMLLFGPVLVAGAALAFTALGDRDSDPSFALAQERLAALDAAAVERAVGSAPEPRADERGQPASSTRCTPGPPGTQLRNPWRCRAEYPSGAGVWYTVRVQPDGAFRGVSDDGTRTVFGRIPLPG